MTSWRDVQLIHPAAEMFPLMADTDPAALKELGEDIKTNGLTWPIALWSDGKSPAVLLDGRNRLDAIEIAIGPVTIGPPSIIAGKDFLACNKVIVLDAKVDPYAYVISTNLHRRHLNPEQREEALFKLIAHAPEKSDRQIAKEIGVDHKTIGRARAKGEDVGRIPHVETRTDTRGRQQPARRKPKPAEADLEAWAAGDISMVEAARRGIPEAKKLLVAKMKPAPTTQAPRDDIGPASEGESAEIKSKPASDEPLTVLIELLRQIITDAQQPAWFQLLGRRRQQMARNLIGCLRSDLHALVELRQAAAKAMPAVAPPTDNSLDIPACPRRDAPATEAP
jgi:ParB-like chromosome segregation protein Spo0J